MTPRRRRELSTAELAGACLVGAVVGAGAGHLLDELFGGDASVGFSLVMAAVLFVVLFAAARRQARRRAGGAP